MSASVAEPGDGEVYEGPLPRGFVIPCCYGTAVYEDPARCTCWEPVYSDPQAPAAEPFPPPSVRTGCCGTCGVVDGLTDDLGIERAAVAGRAFFCHQGFRRVVEYHHPDGRIRAANPHDYGAVYAPAPHNTVPLRADGQPAQLCAAWAKWARESGHDWMDRGEWPAGKAR